MNVFPSVTLITVFPILAGLLIPFFPNDQGRRIRWYALGVGLTDFIFIIIAFIKNYHLDYSGYQMKEDYEWISFLHLHWSLAVDGISMPLILLTGFVTTLALLSAWPITYNPKLFYFLMLAMYSGQIGVFAAHDILLFFIMWELELIPVYLLVSIWGGKRRLHSATKFILYTALGSIFILIGAVTMASSGDFITFNMEELANRHYPILTERLLYLGFIIAYGVKLPAFPLHTWLPDTHGEAHYSTCMLLAGILLKMGGYALIRVNMQMLPHAHVEAGPFLAIIGVINIIYAALTALAQRNLKRKIAYSSISHMGFILIGISSLTDTGLSGVMLQMISHGLIGAALFFLAGTTYDRTQTIILEDMGSLGKRMPKIFALFSICSLASLALPGMSGFVSEIMVFLGFLNSDAYSLPFRLGITFFEAIGILLTPVYLLGMVRQMFYGSSINIEYEQSLQDANPREVFITACFILPIIGIGIYPRLVTELYSSTTVNIVDTIIQNANI